jgi:DNA-binding CsgD family transcriptional regulator
MTWGLDPLSSSRRYRSLVLAGRDSERARIAALVDAARSGHGGALVVRGVAGVGKSTLLADAAAAAAASEMCVLRTSGVESESPLAFAALQRLLWPLRNRIEALPAPQRSALRAVMGEAEGVGDRFLAFLGTLSVLADAADEAPVVAIVDDAHWLDDASAAALLFVARRLQDEPVALVLAARDGDPHGFEASDVPTLVLGGVAGEAAAALLSARLGGSVDNAVRDQLVTATGGNPLALVELAGVLTADQLAGRTPLPAQLPLTGGVEHGFLDRYRRLSSAGQRFLLLVAADDTARVSVVTAAARRLGIGEDAIDESERAGLLRVDGDVLVLYHPLVRSAVYRAATSGQRRAVHRALADVLGGDPDRHAWHLAAATDRPDENVVTALDAVAERAAARGGHEAASAAWARAAELTVDGPQRGNRLLRAASSAWLGAHPSRGAGLATAAAADVTDPAQRVRLLTLQGQIEWNIHSLNDGYDLILQAAQLAVGVDEAMARPLAMLAAALWAFGARSPRSIDPSSLVTEPSQNAAARDRAAWLLLQGFAATGRQDWTVAARSFQRAFDLTAAEPLEGDHVLQPNLGIAAWVIDNDDQSLRLHEQQLIAARTAGALSMAEHALTRGFPTQLAVGDWAKAAGAAAEALPLAASMGQPGLLAMPTAELALIAAMRGDDAADHHIAAVTSIRGAHPVGITDSLVVDMTHWAQALRAAHQPISALHHLEQLRLPAFRRMAALDVYDVALRAGRLDVVRSWCEEVEQFAAASGTASAVAAVEHGRALLADGAEVDEHFRAALDAHHRSPRRPDRARTHLAYGEYLRRVRRRVDARDQLRAALMLFEELGAVPYAERAAQELRASGETARRRDVSTATELTAQERQVVALVRQGLSNRDVAARLFVSPRTVDFHLRNTFAKLGVSSRAELTALSMAS